MTAIYQPKPTPTILAQQINDQDDADEWLSQLTDRELVGFGTYSDVEIRIKEEEGTFELWYTFDIPPDGPMRSWMSAPLGGWAGANQMTPGLFANSDEVFQAAYQPYPGSL